MAGAIVGKQLRTVSRGPATGDSAVCAADAAGIRYVGVPVDQSRAECRQVPEPPRVVPRHIDHEDRSRQSG